ncbi:MAG: low molecular weight phosphotyrosine protein phosphatase [Bacilli bacterium]|nr:low molecular weight phosphotyrosine protein phosphatase [Bacilli bacterium]
MKKIVFVCHGNICRSPMGEYIFKYLTKDRYIVESRATSLEEIGNDIYPPVKEILDKYAIPYDSHKATQLTIDDYNFFDIIVCFDSYNVRNVELIANDETKVVKLLDNDIEDPWYTGNYDKVYHEIYEGCINFINKYNL